MPVCGVNQRSSSHGWMGAIVVDERRGELQGGEMVGAPGTIVTVSGSALNQPGQVPQIDYQSVHDR